MISLKSASHSKQETPTAPPYIWEGRWRTNCRRCCCRRRRRRRRQHRRHRRHHHHRRCCCC